MELKIKKIGKMIKKVLNGKLEMSEICFKDLCHVYDNLTNEKLTKDNLTNVKEVVKTDIKPIDIFSLTKPKEVKMIVRFKTVIQLNMINVISEIKTNELFLKRKNICKNL